MKLSTILAVLAVALVACITCTGCNELKASAKPVAPNAAQTNSLQAADVAIGKVSSKLDDLQASVGGVQLIATTIQETAVATRENTEALRMDLAPKVDNIDRNVADVLDVVGKIAEQLGPGTDAIPHKAAPAKAAPVPVPIDAPPNEQADRHTAVDDFDKRLDAVKDKLRSMGDSIREMREDGSVAYITTPTGETLSVKDFIDQNFKGRIWSHPGRTIDDELARHGVGGDVIALDVKVKEKLHSAIHERDAQREKEAARLRTADQAVVKERTVVRGPVQSCPGGNCPVPQLRAYSGTMLVTPRDARKAARGR